MAELETQQLEDSIPEWEKKQDENNEALDNKENSNSVAEGIKEGGELKEFIDKEINDVNLAKEIIKKKYPKMDVSKWKQHEIINSAKRIQKEAQNLRRFENRKGSFEATNSDKEAVVKSLSYKEGSWEIIVNINKNQEIHLKTKFSSWNETFDKQLDPELKKRLDAKAYWNALASVHYLLEWRRLGDESKNNDQFSKLAKEVEAKMFSQYEKSKLSEYFKAPWNVQKLINAFKWIPVEELNKENFNWIKEDLAYILLKSKDFTFTMNDFEYSGWLWIDYKDKKVTYWEEKYTRCNAKITWIDENWIHLLNTATWAKTTFSVETYNNALKAKEQDNKDHDYIKAKIKEIKASLNISEGMALSDKDYQKVDNILIDNALTKDKKLYDIFYKRFDERNKSWGYWRNSAWAEDITPFLKKNNINVNIEWRWDVTTYEENWEKTFKVDFWETQVYFQFWKKPRVEQHIVTQNEINTKLTEKEKSPNYKRALDIIEKEKESWMIDLWWLGLTSKEVWNLFSEADLGKSKWLDIKLNDNRITTIPQVLFQTEKIKSLDLWRNNISNLDFNDNWKFDKKYCKINKLDLWSNKIKEIPDEFFKNIDWLDEFNISWNKISKLPDSIDRLENLKSCIISWNAINKIPDSLTNCRQLENLSAGYNNISELPEWLSKLVDLKFLSLSSNELTKLPDLNNLQKLEYLNISYNKITSLPKLSTKSLKEIDIVECEDLVPSWKVIKEKLNKAYPDIEVNIEWSNNTRILSWETIKDRYFSGHSENEKLSWDPNEFFEDSKDYKQTWIVADSSESWIQQARKDMELNDNDQVFTIERKQSDWRVIMEIFAEKRE